jgi:hypothetical protein
MEKYEVGEQVLVVLSKHSTQDYQKRKKQPGGQRLADDYWEWRGVVKAIYPSAYLVTINHNGRTKDKICNALIMRKIEQITEEPCIVHSKESSFS